MNYKKFFALFLITAVCLMTVALYNGFPLVESDTGAYIEQAIYPHFAADRTPFYGLFVRVTTLWTSLWFTIFAQCLILSYLLLRYILLLQMSANKQSQADMGFTLLSIIVIISFTCVSWVTSYIMPDIFAGILLLGIFLYIYERPQHIITNLSYLAIIFLAVLIHNSHFIITSLLATALLLYAMVKKNKELTRKSLVLFSVCFGVWVILCSMNKIKKHGFTFSRGSDIFMMAKLSETGILNEYLNESCGKKNLDLCNYQGHIPGDPNEFLWSGESPLYKTGGWDSVHPDYKIIIRDVFTTPKYVGMFVQKSVVSTLEELTQIQAPDKLSVLGKDSEPWKKVRQYFSDELREYSTSLQNTDSLSASSCNFVYYLFFVLSSLWVLLFYRKVMDSGLIFIYSFILLSLLINAFVTSTFSNVLARYQNRMFWILPATNAIVIIKYYRDKYQSVTDKNDNGQI